MATIGLTKDAGWEAGVRRTVPVEATVVWAYLTGDGLPTWLGKTKLMRAPNFPYETAEGTHGVIRGWSERRRIRLTWQPSAWTHEATVQMTLIPVKLSTTIAFYVEGLEGAGEREAMIAHWGSVLDKIESELPVA
jgi:hypothetical protein